MVHPETACRGAGVAFFLVWLAALGANSAIVYRDWETLRPLTSGSVAPDVALRTIDEQGLLGPAESLLAHRGKVVVLDFWATWCGPCRRSMPAVKEFAEKYKERGVVVLSINTEDSDTAVYVRRFANRFVPGLRLYSDGAHAASLAYGAASIPYLVVIDRDGVVRSTHRGFKSVAKLLSDLEEEVAPLL